MMTRRRKDGGNPMTSPALTSTPRPGSVATALVLVGVQIVVMIVAAITAAFATVDGKPFAVTVPAFLIVLYALVAYYLLVGKNWARVLTMTVAALGLIGHLSVAFYYGHATTMTVHIVAAIIALVVLILLALPASRDYFHHAR
jgi:hypothetical protein